MLLRFERFLQISGTCRVVSGHLHRLVLALIVCLLIQAACLGQAVTQNAAATLRSDQWTASIRSGQPVRFIDAAAPVARVEAPLAVDVVDAAGKVNHLSARYTSVETDGTVGLARGSITCPGGSVLDFVDRFSAVANRGAFALSRQVTVRSANGADTGFRTEFEVQSESARDISDVEPFVPGIWYCDSSHVPASVVITDPHLREYLFREDRLPIPLSVRFLIDMHRATDDARYLNTAIRASEFGIKDIGTNANYYGGTADNDDVKDKEAGWIATDSFLSLYEATQQPRWLTAADKAATFTETWTYCWNVPLPIDQPNRTVPDMKTTAGMSLIATGQSAADVLLAFAPYAYYRLSLYNQDPLAAALARIFLYDARQLIDIDGSHGYAVGGLMTEASTLAGDRGHSVGVWLPWCTAAVLDPLQQLQHTFGSMDLDEIDRLPLDSRLKLLDANTHGPFDQPNSKK